MKNKIFESAKETEIIFFDEAASLRDSKDKIISQEVDIRRATKYIPNNGEKFHVIDPHMENIKSGKARNRYIDLVAHKPGGRVLDLGCGSGWLSLELARKGQIVDAYDISSKSISLAKKTLKANPYKEGFGKINYYNKDFSNIDFGENKYDAISGWAAFYYMPDIKEFLTKVDRALKPGGIIATMDDMEKSPVSTWIEYFFLFILPIHTLTYKQKLIKIFNVGVGKDNLRKKIIVPMEKSKHNAKEDIEIVFYEKYIILYHIRENGFCGLPCMRLIGPDFFRYSLARILKVIDYLACKIGLVKGFERVIVAKKTK